MACELCAARSGTCASSLEVNKAPWILASINILPGKAKLAVNHEPSNGNARVSHLPPPLCSVPQTDTRIFTHLHTCPDTGSRGGKDEKRKYLRGWFDQATGCLD